MDTFPYTEDFQDTEADDDRPHYPPILAVGADESDEVPHFPDPLPDREPSKPECVQLRIECERLRAEASRLRLDAREAAFHAEQLVAECASAGHRVTDLEEKIADLTAREGAPQRYERLAEAQIDLRNARARYESKCEAADAAREAAESAETEARTAESAAAEACRRAEECEAEAD